MFFQLQPRLQLLVPICVIRDAFAFSTFELDEVFLRHKFLIIQNKFWSRRWDSNPRPPVYKTGALPLSYAGTRHFELQLLAVPLVGLITALHPASVCMPLFSQILSGFSRSFKPRTSGLPKKFILNFWEQETVAKGGCSTLKYCRNPQQRVAWAGRDSNLRRREPTDLQSVPFDRFGTDPRVNGDCGFLQRLPASYPPSVTLPLSSKICSKFSRIVTTTSEPMRGFEPRTTSLPWRCSTN